VAHGLFLLVLLKLRFMDGVVVLVVLGAEVVLPLALMDPLLAVEVLGRHL
jgi:hypothetical protein